MYHPQFLILKLYFPSHFLFPTPIQISPTQPNSPIVTTTIATATFPSTLQLPNTMNHCLPQIHNTQIEYNAIKCKAIRLSFIFNLSFSSLNQLHNFTFQKPHFYFINLDFNIIDFLHSFVGKLLIYHVGRHM